MESGASTSTSTPTEKPSEFVNYGLLHWHQARVKWLESRRADDGTKQQLQPKMRSLSLCAQKRCWLCSWSLNQKSILSSNKAFRQPIPLEEMVEFLVEIWEQEGMFD